MEDREVVVTELCIRKCAEMDAMGSLKNHKTGWYALKALPSEHRESLKRMGYGVTRLDAHRGLLQPKTLVFTQHILDIVAKPCHTTSILPGSMRTTARRAVSQSLRRSGAVLGCTIDEYCHLWSLRRPQGLPLYEVPLRSCLFAQFRLNSSEHYHILYGGLCKTGKALTQCQK